jgi:DNA-binding beta-propeller fold protein YncE
MSMQVSSPSFEPDPNGELSSGEPLMLPPAVAHSPLAPGNRLIQAQAARLQFGGPKALRPDTERPPRARRIDPRQTLGALAGGGVPLPPPAAPVAAAAPAPTVFWFETGGDDNTTIPPDVAGAFSETHAFNALNNNIHCYDRTNPHTPLSTTTLNAFWNREGCFDPKVVYDPQAKCFFFAAMSGAATAQSSLLIAVSSGGDPSQPWWTQSVSVDPNAQGNTWMDYPSLGFSADKVTVQVNLFALSGNQFAGSTIYVFDKASLLNRQNVFLQRFVLQNQGAGQAPAVTYDAGFGDQYLLSSWGGQLSGAPGALAVWKITGSPAAQTAAIARVGFVTGARTWDSFPPRPEFGPQSGISDQVDVGDDRSLSVIYRNGVLHCCHTVFLPAGNPTRSSVQWWDIPVATWAASGGLLDDPNGQVFYAFPSMALNQRGDALVCHAQFSAHTHLSAGFYLIPAGGAPLGATLAAGQNTYVKRFSGNKNRWGDYTPTQPDPDPKFATAFWTIQGYASAQADTWATRAAQIVPPPLPPSV